MNVMFFSAKKAAIENIFIAFAKRQHPLFAKKYSHANTMKIHRCKHAFSGFSIFLPIVTLQIFIPGESCQLAFYRKKYEKHLQSGKVCINVYSSAFAAILEDGI